MSRTSVFFLLPSVLLFAALFFGGCGKEEEPAQEEKPPAKEEKEEVKKASLTPVDVLQLKPRSFSTYVEYIGHLEANLKVTISAEAEGAVSHVWVEEGEIVKKGQNLLQIDKTNLQVSQNLAQANYNLRQAEYKRAANLFEQKIITKAELDLALNQKEVSLFNLRSAKLRVRDSLTKSPIEGKVSVLFIEQGEYAQKGKPLATLLDLSSLKASVNIPEKDLGIFQLGKEVEVRVKQKDSQSALGRVSLLGLEGNLSSRSFPMEVTLSSPPEELRPGMLVHIRAVEKSYQNELVVPRSAVLEKDDGRTVLLVEEGRIKERPVELGVSFGSNVQILQGLEFEDNLVVRGQTRAIPEERVEVINRL